MFGFYTHANTCAHTYTRYGWGLLLKKQNRFGFNIPTSQPGELGETSGSLFSWAQVVHLVSEP